MVETGWRPYPREAICSGPRDLYFHATVFFVDDLIVCKDHPERNRVQGSLLLQRFQGYGSGTQGRPAECVSDGDGNFSGLDPEGNHQLSGVFDLAPKLAPFVGPERDEALTKVPERDPDASPEDLRPAAVQQLSSNHQTITLGMQLQEQVKFIRLGAIEQVPLTMCRRAHARGHGGETVED